MSSSHNLIVTLLAALCFSLLKFFCWAVDSIHDKEFQQGKMR